MIGFVFSIFFIMCYFSSHMDKPECLIAAALFYIGGKIRMLKLIETQYISSNKGNELSDEKETK